MDRGGLGLLLPGGRIWPSFDLTPLTAFRTCDLLVALGVAWEAVPHSLVGEDRLRLSLLLLPVLPVWDLRRGSDHGALQLLLLFVHYEGEL